MDLFIMKKSIILTGFSIVVALASYAQHRVTGIITGVDQRPIAGAIVLVKASTVSAVTNEQGRYTINAPFPSASLIASAEGTISVEIPINARSVIDIKLGKEITPTSEVARNALGIGEWNVGFSGNINTRFTTIMVDKSDAPPTIHGSWVSTKGSGEDQVFAIAHGFAPAILAFNANRQFADNTKINIVISSWFGLATSRAIVDFAPVDVRQIFALISNEKWGAVKFGRDNGLWAQEQRLNDISIIAGNGFLFNIRTPPAGNPGGNGAGYTFNDRLAQISYFTPKWNGLEAAVGVFQPLDFGSLGAADVSITSTGFTETNSTRPAVNGKLKYTKALSKSTTLNLVTSAVAQKNLNEIIDFTAWTVDGFAKIDHKGLALSGYYYNGVGTGIGAYMVDAADVQGLAREVEGGYVQLAYTFGKEDKWLAGTYYGVSRLGQTVNDPDELLAANTRATGILKYRVLPPLLLSAEYTWMHSNNHRQQTLANHAYSIGTYLSF